MRILLFEHLEKPVASRPVGIVHDQCLQIEGHHIVLGDEIKIFRKESLIHLFIITDAIVDAAIIVCELQLYRTESGRLM